MIAKKKQMSGLKKKLAKQLGLNPKSIAFAKGICKTSENPRFLNRRVFTYGLHSLKEVKEIRGSKTFGEDLPLKARSKVVPTLAYVTKDVGSKEDSATFLVRNHLNSAISNGEIGTSKATKSLNGILPYVFSIGWLRKTVFSRFLIKSILFPKW